MYMFTHAFCAQLICEDGISPAFCTGWQDPPNPCFPGSLDYRYEPPCPVYKQIFETGFLLVCRAADKT
jgi:hypothetical protein